jgi:glycosyltransferase involved in cell wall biosynthesis
MNSIAILIPAYQPEPALLTLVDELSELLLAIETRVPIYVVNDGSHEVCAPIFEALAQKQGVVVVNHATNLGKGAALKTGFNTILTSRLNVTSIVTADADGQHAPGDIVNVVKAATQHPELLYLGTRQFDDSVPSRSRIGNVITRSVTRFLTGLTISDTQTGLRALPRSLCLEALRIPLNGYDFEMECLVTFQRTSANPKGIREIPIRTLYVDGNRGSHFNPLIDSMRIYFVFLRYLTGSLLTFATDYAVFVVTYTQTGSIGLGVALARAVATFVSFFFNRQAVFRANGKVAPAFMRFLLLVVAMGCLSYLATSFLTHTGGISAPLSKLLVEAMLFFASFALNKIFVFGRQAKDDATSTDWDDYYNRPYRTASVTRGITTRLLIRLMREHAQPTPDKARFQELGGANSCFLDAMRETFTPSEYHIVDNNRTGLERTRERFEAQDPIYLHEVDLLHASTTVRADITYSAGLIEHFDPAGTKKLVAEHFEGTRDGGLVIITFPTPTWLYRGIRGIAERMGMWIFHDERPLSEKEVLAAASGKGTVLYNRINWAIGLTQRVIAFRNEKSASTPN